MAVNYQPTQQAAANFSDNLCRWKARNANHYEVWFLTLNHRASQRGFWFRYTMRASRNPATERGDASDKAALWATTFDRKAPERNFSLKREYSLDRFAFEGEENFVLKLGDGLFTSSSATGEIKGDEHSVAWDLRFAPNQKTYHHLSPSLSRLLGGSSFVCSPNLDTRFSGAVVVDGRETILEQEPGCQSHLWGRKHIDEWVWVHSNAFEGHPGTVFEGVAARPRIFGRMLPPTQSLFLRHRGEEHHFVRLRLAEQWRRDLGIGYWALSAMNTQVYIEGAAQCRLRDMLQVEYTDTNGTPLYCVNSEVANLKIRIFRRVRGIHWRHVETIKSRATAHLERASRQIDPDVKRA